MERFFGVDHEQIRGHEYRRFSLSAFRTGFREKKLETIKYPSNFEEQKLRDLKREIKSAKRHLATRQTRMKGF
jgi:hypothetical protein